MKILRLVGMTIFIALVGIQFIPTSRNINPEIPSTDFILTYKVPDEVGRLLHTSCYNCHSNNTAYPWYSKIQPVSWFLDSHIKKGKAELNFSEFGTYSVRKQKSKLKSMVNQIEKDEMPLSSYTFIHRDAKLSQESRKLIVDNCNALLDSIK
jgi:hypothetical protein